MRSDDFVLAGQIGEVKEALVRNKTDDISLLESLGMLESSSVGTIRAVRNTVVSFPYNIEKGDRFRVRAVLTAGATYITVSTRKDGTVVEVIINASTTSQDIIFEALSEANEFAVYSRTEASNVIIDKISKDIEIDVKPEFNSGKPVKSGGIAAYVDEHTTIGTEVYFDTLGTNIMLDNGSVSTNASTEGKYNVKKYPIQPNIDYKARSRVRGSGYHQVLFKTAGGTVVGTLSPVTKDEIHVTFISHSDIPSNAAFIYVNGYIEEGDEITLSSGIVDVRELSAEIPSLKITTEELKETVFGAEGGYKVIPPTGTNYNGDAHYYRFQYNSVLENGDVIELSCGEGYQYRAYLMNGSTVVKSYSDDYISIPSTIDYQDGSNRLFLVLFKKVDGTMDSEAEGIANSFCEARRAATNGGLVALKPTIKALFIGNSVSQDHVSYLPWLLKNTYGGEVDFQIFIAYRGGATIKEYVENIITGNVNLGIFSVADNTESWTNTNNLPYASMWTLHEYFDLICFEGYFNHGTPSAGLVEDTSYFARLIDDLKSRQTKPFKLGYLIHQTYTNDTHTEADAWERIVAGAGFAISNNPVSILFPCGVVTKLVNGIIPQSMLTNDLTHNQQGLPCIMGAYVLMEELARYLGLPSRVVNNQLRITAATEEGLNIPGQNGTLQIGTDEQYSLCQDAAVKAVKYGDYLMISNSVL